MLNFDNIHNLRSEVENSRHLRKLHRVVGFEASKQVIWKVDPRVDLSKIIL